MKNLRMYLLAVLAGVALSASAQFVNVGSSGSSRLTSVTTDGWNRLYVSYLPSKLKTDGEDALKMKGFSVGYMRGISVTNKIPLYIEVGAAFQYRAEKEDYLSAVALQLAVKVVELEADRSLGKDIDRLDELNRMLDEHLGRL